MAKHVHLNLLQYLLDHQNPNDNYLNRYFVIRCRLITENGHYGFIVDRAKRQLIQSGYIKESTNPRPLSVTEAGIQFLHKENQTGHPRLVLEIE